LNHPATRSDIILEGQWTLTTANQRFLLADDGNDFRGMLSRVFIVALQLRVVHIQ
jgi:hypothetical protein